MCDMYVVRVLYMSTAVSRTAGLVDCRTWIEKPGGWSVAVPVADSVLYGTVRYSTVRYGGVVCRFESNVSML